MSRNRRISRRKKAAKGEKARKLIPLAAKISGLLCIVFLVCFVVAKIGRVVPLPEIPINDIRFEGIGTLDKMELLKKINIELGANLLNIDLKQIAKRLLEAEPLIKDAEVGRNFYSGQFTIKLRLREAIALLNCNGIYGVDGDGVVIGEMERISPRDLPIITGVRVKDVRLGQTIKSNLLDRALEIHRLVSSSNLESIVMLSEINVRDSRHHRDLIDVVLYVGKDGTEIRLGSDQFQENIDKAVAILAEREGGGEKTQYIDFRLEKRIIVKPKK